MNDNDPNDGGPGRPAQAAVPPTAAPSTVDPETIFVAPNAIRGLAVTGDHVYFSTADEYVDRFGSDSDCKEGKVGRIRRDGAGPVVWIAPSAECPGALVIVQDYVVFREPSMLVAQPTSQKGTAKRRADDRSEPDYALVGDAERVFFVDPKSDRLTRWSPSTGASRAMGRSSIHHQLAVSGASLVISESSRLRLLAVDGSSDRILAETKRDRFGLTAVNGSQALFVREVDGNVGGLPEASHEIIRINIAQPQPPEVLHRTEGPLLEMAVDDRRVYFVAQEGRTSKERLESIGLDGKDHRQLSNHIGPFENLALDEAHVYFSVHNRILRVRKDATAPSPPASANPVDPR
jgi:hypothetical protein